MRDLYAEAQAAAEARLDYCDELAEGDAPEWDGPGEPPSALYCGCRTCTIRETLHAALATLVQIAEEERSHA